MNDTRRFQCWGAIFYLLFFLGCNKEDACNPTPSKRVVSEVSNSGVGFNYSYSNYHIGKSISSNGSTIQYLIVTNHGSELLFQEWDEKTNGELKLIGTYYLGVEYSSLGPQSFEGVRAHKYIRESGGTQTYEYNNSGNLVRSVLTFPPNFNIPPQIVLNTWKDGNIISSVSSGVTFTYEYYTDNVNTLGNDFFGKTHLGVSSKNPVKREISHSNAGNLTTDYTYEYDTECFITTVTSTTTDETGKIISSSWRKFTYE